MIFFVVFAALGVLGVTVVGLLLLRASRACLALQDEMEHTRATVEPRWSQLRYPEPRDRTNDTMTPAHTGSTI